MKCDTCSRMKSGTLGHDEVGTGNPFSYCSKGHWDLDPQIENKPVDDIWKECHDYKTTTRLRV